MKRHTFFGSLFPKEARAFYQTTELPSELTSSVHMMDYKCTKKYPVRGVLNNPVFDLTAGLSGSNPGISRNKDLDLNPNYCPLEDTRADTNSGAESKSESVNKRVNKIYADQQSSYRFHYSSNQRNMNPQELSDGGSEPETFEVAVKEIVGLVLEDIEKEGVESDVRRDIISTVALGLHLIIEDGRRNLEEGLSSVNHHDGTNIDNQEFPETPVPAITPGGREIAPRVLWLITRKILDHPDELCLVSLALVDELISIANTNTHPDN
ncbi:hypothetical protein HD806DRAFT_527886 [Xylariaceae sp. AK1471]|nr:hypothetical protein HD806DRAFT_527886 [Xylariaceae sp. AK1471]